MVLNLPNLLSTLRIFLSPIFIWLILSDSPVNIGIAIILFFIAAITDFFDGWIARRYKDVTEWGAFFDPLADKVLTNSALIAFAMKEWIPLWMVFIIIARDIAVTLLRLYGESVGHPIQTRRSAKWKTLLQMLFILYTLILYFLLYPMGLQSPVLRQLFHPTTLTLLFAVVTLLTLYTAAEYVVTNRSLFRHLWQHQILPSLRNHIIEKIWLSCFGIGYIPVLPGTIASVVTLGLWFFFPVPLWQQVVVAGTVLLLSLIAVATMDLHTEDPSWVVADEVIGMLTALLFLPPHPPLLSLLSSFLLFRILDIWKPLPIKAVEKLPLLGIFADDLLAGMLAGVTTVILEQFLW